MAITAPSDLAAVAVSPSRINLSWSNPQGYDDIAVDRSLNGSTWSQIATLLGTATSYSDSSCQDGTKYYYRLQVAVGDIDPETAISNSANATTPLPAPSGLSGTSDSGGTECVLTWIDNCQNESGFKVYKNGSLLATLGPNVETYTATSLTPGASYSFYVKAYNSLTTSAASNTETVVMSDPPAAPSGLTAEATATTGARLNWVDNADNEIDFKVEQSSTSASAGFAVIATVSRNITTYAVTGLTSNTQYWFRVRSRNSSGYSKYCTVATAVTWAAIAAPTNLVVVAARGTIVDLYFDDNSSEEDYHSLEMKEGAGAYSEIAQLEPNRNAYRVTGLTKNTTYTFKVRAYQDPGSYSGYSDEVAVTTPNNPSVPTDLAVSEYQDKWVRLTWSLGTTDVDRVTISYSLDDITYTNVVVPDLIEEFRVTGLTAGTLYYFKVAAGNGAGYGSATAAIQQTTRSSYSPSAFERLIRKSSPKLIYLVEANPAIELGGWTLTDGSTYTYEISFDQRGCELDDVRENGTSLTEQTSAADVESNAGSWYHDVINGKVYIHSSGSDDPGDYVMIGSFWMFFTTHQEAGNETVFNGNYYLPLVASDGIPDISQEISPYFEGNFVISSGSVSFINGEINGVNFFDKKFGTYLWLNRKIRILAGGEDFDYSDFHTVNTGIVDSYECTDRRMTFSLRDYRDGIHRTLPIEKYSTDEFAALDTNAVDRVKPYGYGTITNAVPICIDTNNRIFEFHNGRIRSVENVYQNGSTLVVDTDYFVDYRRGRIILAASLPYATDDIILVDFTGAVTEGDNPITTGAHIFKSILNNFLNVGNDDLDLDSIWATHLSKTTALSLYLWKEIDSQELIRRIEHSIQADTFQDAEGRLGIKVRLTGAPSGISYIPNEFVMDGFSMSRNRDSIFSEINIWYGEDSSQDKFSLLRTLLPSATYMHGVSKVLDVYTALSSASDAATLSDAVVDVLDKTKVMLTVPRVLFTHMPGDVVYLTRDRFFKPSGTANRRLMRILSISKQQSGGRTQVILERV